MKCKPEPSYVQRTLWLGATRPRESRRFSFVVRAGPP